MSEPTDLDDIYILLDELQERRGSLMVNLATELGCSYEESLWYVKKWLHHNGE